MIAYTAWDSLQTIARQYGGRLTVAQDGQLALTPPRTPSVTARPGRRLAQRVRVGLAALHGTSSRRA